MLHAQHSCSTLPAQRSPLNAPHSTLPAQCSTLNAPPRSMLHHAQRSTTLNTPPRSKLHAQRSTLNAQCSTLHAPPRLTLQHGQRSTMNLPMAAPNSSSSPTAPTSASTTPSDLTTSIALTTSASTSTSTSPSASATATTTTSASASASTSASTSTSTTLTSFSKSILLHNKYFENHLDHLVASGAFNNDYPRRAKGLRAHIKRCLESWEFLRKDRIYWEASISISILKWSLKNSRGQYSLPIMQNSKLSTFHKFKSGSEHLEIRDKDSCLLAYHFKIPFFLVDGLVESHELLPELEIHHQRKIDPRGEFPIRHYATWADSSLDIFHSKDYLTQQPASGNWIERNKSLWRYLGDRLKLIIPETYNKLTNINLPEPLELLCNPWSGTAINQQMTPDSILQHHQD
ncbi:hypothetical protein L211DRAFT_875760 [Terfezia boudieri ATCC MYA-4762]|uniref:Uncharacterized protein n=1 Tax=Terfezia boudieri ATCC MYA-4762 TaxID=1051890 RepID=A0A3N4LCF5_9PEZI|nr:hypothetical protein L211DRAFT_875760 [Terfezia boudieri ATCC MYA-4762]